MDKDTIENSSTSSYCEIKNGKTLYRVTSIFTGEIELKNTLEDLTVKRILNEIQNK